MENEFDLNIYEIMKTSTPAGRHSEDGEPAGDTIRNMILDNWDQHEKIKVFFEGVAKMTRPFVDEAFAKILDYKSLEEFNQKLFFPDANDSTVKSLNDAIKLRLKIIKVKKDKEDLAGGL